MNGIVAVKNYGFEWYLRHGLSEADAAKAMVRHGIDWVAVPNLRDPLPTSAVVQEPVTIRSLSGQLPSAFWRARSQRTPRSAAADGATPSSSASASVASDVASVLLRRPS